MPEQALVLAVYILAVEAAEDNLVDSVAAVVEVVGKASADYFRNSPAHRTHCHHTDSPTDLG